MSYQYILRYYIDPGFHETERIDELVELCNTGQIGEVMLFYNPEELFHGSPSDESIEAWFRMARRVKDALSAHRIAMSLNPWTTTVHLSRGRKSTHPEFQPLVGETGVPSVVTSCPLSEFWLNRLCSLFGRMARELQPVALWIEDDWRLHNHEASMNYGGCFCPLHMARFSEAIGRQVNREELLEELLIHNNQEWRQAWLRLSQETLTRPAKLLAQAIHAAAPAVRIGLMSSTPDIHSVEGREWQLLKLALSPDEPLLLRPHLAPYTEKYALEQFPAVTRQAVSEFRASDLKIYPELENSPRCGRYSKSATYSVFQMLSSPLYGSRGITINHYDMMGNGLALDADFPAALAKAKPRLDALSELGLNEDNAVGVNILHAPSIAGSIRAKRPDSLWGLENDSIHWGRTLGILGIATQFSRAIDRDRITAVSDQTLRAFSDAEITELLRGRLLIDAPSAEILCERHFEDLIGIDSPQWRTLNESGFSYEEIIATGERMSAQRCANRLLECRVTDAETITRIMRYDHTELYPGMTLYRNCLGGTVLFTAYPPGENQFFMGYFNSFRRKLMQKTFLTMQNDLVCTLDHPLHTYCNRLDRNHLLISIINATNDPLSQVRFQSSCPFAHVQVLQPDGQWTTADLRQDRGIFTWSHGLAPLDGLFLLFEQ